MANVINGTTYSSLAQQIGVLVDVMASGKNYLFTAVTIVAQLNDINPTVDLIIPFNTTYQLQTSVLNNTSNLVAAARALNSHVLLRAVQPNGTPYTDINQWFDDQETAGYNISYPEAWATLCGQSGTNVSQAFVNG